MLSVIFPVYNEKKRLKRGITKTVSYLEKLQFSDAEIIIVDNASTDETPEIAAELAAKYPNVTYRRLEIKGVGAAFREGVTCSLGDIVGYMDIDLSADIRHLEEVIQIFQKHPEVTYLNGSRFAKASKTTGRKWYRKITSKGLVLLLKICLGMKCTDAICGFTFVRRTAAQELIQVSSRENGWFYLIEFLLRAERMGQFILDYPVTWKEDYDTTVRLIPTICNYSREIGKLFWIFHVKEKKPTRVSNVHGIPNKR
jgi:glycosyltransferase involved in cell wall biosynthesis